MNTKIKIKNSFIESFLQNIKNYLNEFYCHKLDLALFYDSNLFIKSVAEISLVLITINKNVYKYKISTEVLKMLLLLFQNEDKETVDIMSK